MSEVADEETPGKKIYYEEIRDDILVKLCSNPAKFKVVDFILNNSNGYNQFKMAQRQAHKEIQAQERKEGKKKNLTSWETVNQTFEALMEANVLTKKGSIYIFNPKGINVLRLVIEITSMFK
ncbi:hypothetical protein ID0476_13590 [Helicobacter pylori]